MPTCRNKLCFFITVRGFVPTGRNSTSQAPQRSTWMPWKHCRIWGWAPRRRGRRVTSCCNKPSRCGPCWTTWPTKTHRHTSASSISRPRSTRSSLLLLSLTCLSRLSSRWTKKNIGGGGGEGEREIYREGIKREGGEWVSNSLVMCVCVCVCERERERERLIGFVILTSIIYIYTYIEIYIYI